MAGNKCALCGLDLALDPTNPASWELAATASTGAGGVVTGGGGGTVFDHCPLTGRLRGVTHRVCAENVGRFERVLRAAGKGELPGANADLHSYVQMHSAPPGGWDCEPTSEFLAALASAADATREERWSDDTWGPRWDA